MDNLHKIALVQYPPVYLNLAKSIKLAEQYISEVSQKGAQLIVFPETWLPGYPAWLDYAPNAGVWDHPPAKALFRILFQNSIEIGDTYFKKLRQAAIKNSCTIVMGANEKAGRTLYNTIFYFLSDGSYQLHRKLMPTYTERLVWGMGDGSTLSIIKDGTTKIGGLVCWEHWMPLVRAAMHQQGEHIHVAQWPMVKDLHQIASRQYAFEAQCYVLAAGCTLTKKQMLEGLKSVVISENDSIALQLIEEIPVNENELILRGGSSVIKPDTSYLVEPVYQENTIIYSELDLSILSEGNLFLDTNGHYSRPDVFHLQVDTRAKTNVRFNG